MRELPRLLIVDDEQAEREGLSFLIAQNRYPFSVRQAANGREALAMLAKDDYAMVLADVKMPIMDGISLSREIRRLYPDMLVVIISAYGDFEYTQQAIKSRVSDYLLKPVDVQEFRRTMDDALDQLGLRMEAGGFQEGAGGEAAPSPGDAVCEGATGRLVSQVMRLIDENYAQLSLRPVPARHGKKRDSVDYHAPHGACAGRNHAHKPQDCRYCPEGRLQQYILLLPAVQEVLRRDGQSIAGGSRKA